MQNDSKLQDIIRTSLENIRSLVDANTVIGNPINTESGTTIIPVSKISVGYVSGGLDYAVKNVVHAVKLVEFFYRNNVFRLFNHADYRRRTRFANVAYVAF